MARAKRKKKAPGKKGPAKKAPGKKAPAKKAPGKKKGPTKKAPGKKGPAKKAPGRKKAPVKAPPKKAPAKRAAAMHAPLEADVDEALVESTVALLDAHDQRDAASRREIGAHVLERYFGGDAEKVRDRRPDKPLSFAYLGQRAEEDTSWSAREIREAVIAAIVYESLPDAMAPLVPPTYLVRLDAVDDPAVRAELASRIARGELRGRPAEDAISAESGGQARGGRKRAPGPVRLARRVGSLIEDADRFGGFDVTEVSSLDPLARAEVAGTIDAAARRLAALAARIRAAR